MRPGYKWSLTDMALTSFKAFPLCCCFASPSLFFLQSSPPGTQNCPCINHHNQLPPSCSHLQRGKFVAPPFSYKPLHLKSSCVSLLLLQSTKSSKDKGRRPKAIVLLQSYDPPSLHQAAMNDNTCLPSSLQLQSWGDFVSSSQRRGGDLLHQRDLLICGCRPTSHSFPEHDLISSEHPTQLDLPKHKYFYLEARWLQPAPASSLGLEPRAATANRNQQLLPPMTPFQHSLLLAKTLVCPRLHKLVQNVYCKALSPILSFSPARKETRLLLNISTACQRH